MKLRFSSQIRERVAKSFESKTFLRGLKYAEENRVQIVKGESWPVVAKVEGSQGYVVQVQRGEDDYLESECSCPVGFECKHGVATALLVFQQEEQAKGGVRTTRQEREVGEWLSQLGSSAQGQPGKPSTNKCIVYILRISNHQSCLAFHRSSHLKKGGFARSHKVADPGRFCYSPPSWASQEDLSFMAQVQSMTRAEDYHSEYDISLLDISILKKLCETGRLFWEDVRSSPISWGAQLEKRLIWEECVADSEEYRLGLGPDMLVLESIQTTYLDLAAYTMGALLQEFSSDMVKVLVTGPSVPKAMMRTALESMSCLAYVPKEPVVHTSPKGSKRKKPTPKAIAFVPQMRIVVEEGGRFGPMLDIVYEALYQEQVFSLAKWEGRGHDLSESEVVRNLSEEGRRLLQANALVSTCPFSLSDAQGEKEVEAAAQYLALEVMPNLMAQGWQCLPCENFPAALPVMDAEWIEELEPVSNAHHWFSFGLDVVVEGKSVALLPILLQAIRCGEIDLDEILRSGDRDSRYLGTNLKVPGGKLVHVSGERLKRWLRPLVELRLRGLNQEDELILPAFTAVDLAEQNPGRFADSKGLEEIRSRLHSLLDLKAKEAGKGFVGELRGYQKEGHAWLRILHEGKLGGLLADDMGLGKTVQVLAFIDGLRASRKLKSGQPVLVVAPRSVVNNWKLEAIQFTPKLRPLVHLGSGRTKNIKELCSYSIVITSYQTLLRDIELLLGISWSTLILDEAQAIKNPKTKLRRAIVRLRSTSRFCITGTPIENHLGELWSQVDVAMPGLLGSKTTFHTVFRTPIEKYGDSRALELLRKRIRPFMLRRTKGEVDIDLPEKTEIVERVSFDSGQRDLYESLRLVLDKEVQGALKERGVQGASLLILDALLKLRQCCCDPRLVKIPEAKKVKGSAKLDRLMTMLCELKDAGRFVLVFSQFTSMLKLIEEECKKSDISYVKLTGQTRHRETVIETFQEGRVPVFLISLKAGGVGLNLTQADTVIHYDPWWNPAVEKQATDRAHRIGQTKNLMVYKLVAENTLEERICVMQKEKQSLTDSALSKGGVTPFNAEDLHSFFQSL